MEADLRAALFHLNEKRKEIAFYFYYDKKVPKNPGRFCAEESTKSIISMIEKDFSIQEICKSIPYPKPIPSQGKRVVYQRSEKAITSLLAEMGQKGEFQDLKEKKEDLYSSFSYSQLTLLRSSTATSEIDETKEYVSKVEPL